MLSCKFLLFCLGIAFFEIAVSQNVGDVEDALKVVHDWKYIDYDFGSDAQRQEAINSGQYNFRNCYPIDVDRWKNLTFVTVIRESGVPSSLNVISQKNGTGGPLLSPYPNWNWTNIDNCSGIVSVYRVAIDGCDRLWVLDTGTVGQTMVCPAKLLTFDLHNSNLLDRIIIPNSVSVNSTTGLGLLVTPVVQTRGQQCEQTIVYISDVEGHALIVYDGKTFRRLTSDAFNYDPRATNYTIEGESFHLQDGIVGMALSSRTNNLYFSPMSSFNLNFVNTRALTQINSSNVQYEIFKDILTTQSSAKAMSKTGALFFGLVNDTSIACWNEQRELNRRNIEIIASNPVTLQFTSGLKIKQCHQMEELWALTNKFQKIADGTFNFNETNFRILKSHVAKLIVRTRCHPPRRMRPFVEPKFPYSVIAEFSEQQEII